MRTRRIKVTAVRAPLARLRVAPIDPDPGFRAGLRERLMATAAARSEDCPNSGGKNGVPGDR
ncbi:UNVERIFIED_ORG: hypothetical protein CLV66_11224 [Actinomadura viridilutea]|nr:hypothetical protein [Actinomadura rubrobrunea]